MKLRSVYDYSDGFPSLVAQPDTPRLMFAHRTKVELIRNRISTSISVPEIDMRLLHVDDMTFVDVPPGKAEKYVILSHCWGSEESEVSYKDMLRGRKMNTEGRRKLNMFCDMVRQYGY